MLRYICQNPVKAKLCRTPFEYPWLGCSGITKAPAFLDELGSLTDLSDESLRQFVSEPCDAEHLEDTGFKRLTDREAIERIRDVCKCQTVQEVGGWPADNRDEAVRKALDSGISIRQLSRLIGISKAVIERIARE